MTQEKLAYMSNTYFTGKGNAREKLPFGIFADQAGYVPGRKKKAVIPFGTDTFRICDENGEVFFEGETTHFGYDECSGDDVYIADFSAFTRCGSYRVTAGGESSAVFRIGDGVYKKVLDDVTKAFYYLRCGTDIEEKYAGPFTHKGCHTGKALIFGENGETDVTGGWHDAGDYGKYVTAGACACAHLLYAFKMFPEVFERQNLNIPESGCGVPDVLSECRYELEWLMKMQKTDGSAYHKATTLEFAPFVMPEDDNADMYVFAASSSATADLCAVCALAAGIYDKYDKEFAERLKSSAELAYGWLRENPEPVVFRNPPECVTGEYGEREDCDNRYWAAAEMFALTGEEAYHDDLKRLYATEFDDRKYFLTALGHGTLGGFGSMAYIFCGRETCDGKIISELKDLFTGESYWLKDKGLKSGYGASMTEEDYYWGSNMTLMKHAMMFILSYKFTGDKVFLEAAWQQASVLLGVNPFGMSYITGNGEFCCSKPHLRTSHSDGIDRCIPGLVSGGPNRELNDEFAMRAVEKGTPPMKCYTDDPMCYSLNEVAIYWNAVTVFVLAYLNTL